MKLSKDLENKINEISDIIKYNVDLTTIKGIIAFYNFIKKYKESEPYDRLSVSNVDKLREIESYIVQIIKKVEVFKEEK